ncbi:MAG: GTPase HflX [Rhizobiales bacterium]|nr:GTPase HflX [Hyphomicrobiales bacterium]
MPDFPDDTPEPASREDKLFRGNPKAPTRAFVMVPWLKSAEQAARKTGRILRSPAARIDEAVGLAAAIDLNVVGTAAVIVAHPRPATLIGEGKVEELKQQFHELEVELVVVDGPLGPGQQRNLEKAWGCKVLDRTGLILEIFGERAQTREGSLQVELAHLNYQKTRLVRSWTHLERQRGGFGFLGGPGETQIEADRRMIQERIVKIARQLETVKRTRELHRKTRRDVPYPIVALVGYTNAGKSTLFNRLTQADVFAQDLLFATLDPTMRAVTLPSGRKIILSDTVGFISDLPTHLVAAFRATLEEVLEAEIIIHVRDVAHEESDIQKADVIRVLASLGITPEESAAAGQHVIEVLNKIDLLGEEARAAAINGTEREPDVVAISAVSGQGIDGLFTLIDSLIQDEGKDVSLLLPATRGEAVAWLHANTHVHRREDRQDGMIDFRVLMSPAAIGRFEKRFPDLAAPMLEAIAAETPERDDPA